MRQFKLFAALVTVVGLLSISQAQDKKKDGDKKAPIAPAEKVAEGWDEIDQRLIFLMIRLANTETSLEAVEKNIAASSRKQSVKLGSPSSGASTSRRLSIGKRENGFSA